MNNMDTESNSGFSNAYFYRSHLLWNRLPLSIRQISSTKEFRKNLKKFIWNSEIGPIYKFLVYDSNVHVCEFLVDQSSSDSD